MKKVREGGRRDRFKSPQINQIGRSLWSSSNPFPALPGQLIPTMPPGNQTAVPGYRVPIVVLRPSGRGTPGLSYSNLLQQRLKEADKEEKFSLLFFYQLDFSLLTSLFDESYGYLVLKYGLMGVKMMSQKIPIMRIPWWLRLTLSPSRMRVQSWWEN